MTPLAFDVSGRLVSPLPSGLVAGCVYGLVALAVVLVYKSNRFFNFATAEFGTVAALVAQHTRTGEGLPKLPTALTYVAGLVAAVVAALTTERLVVRPLFHASRTTLVVATAGVALFLLELELILVGPELALFQPASFTTLFHVGNYTVQVGDLLAVVVLVAVAIGAILFFRTRFGIGILAVSQEPTAAGLVGISVTRISMLTWGLVGFIGGAAGLVYVQKFTSLTPGVMTVGGPLVTGFIAAVLGGMTSLPGAFAGGLAIGLVQSYANANAPDTIPGFSSVVVTMLLLLVLLVRPQGLLGKEA